MDVLDSFDCLPPRRSGQMFLVSFAFVPLNKIDTSHVDIFENFQQLSSVFFFATTRNTEKIDSYVLSSSNYVRKLALGEVHWKHINCDMIGAFDTEKIGKNLKTTQKNAY